MLENKFKKSTFSRLHRQNPAVIWLTGLSGAGKTTIAEATLSVLTERGFAAIILDGDSMRNGLNKDLGFSEKDRMENVRRVAECARMLTSTGLITIVSVLTPLESMRRLARSICKDFRYFEVFVDTPIEVCEMRDPKGLYKLARSGKLPDFTGLTAPFQVPDHSELTLRTVDLPVSKSVEKLLSCIITSDSEMH